MSSNKIYFHKKIKKALCHHIIRIISIHVMTHIPAYNGYDKDCVGIHVLQGADSDLL